MIKKNIITTICILLSFAELALARYRYEPDQTKTESPLLPDHSSRKTSAQQIRIHYGLDWNR